MLDLYQLECRAVARERDIDAAIRRRQRLEQARAASQRSVQACRSALRRPAGAWSAPRSARGFAS